MSISKVGKSNLYYPVFRNLESEVIELSRGIYFSDEQINVYSIKISELLSRCLTEIESLYKDLYRNETNTNPATVGDAWRFLDSEWRLAKKELEITSDNFFFGEYFQPYFAPFDYQNGSDEDFYSAYNAVKHDRAKNLHKANIGLLIRALGALYILNVCYAKEDLTSSIYAPKVAGVATGVYADLGINLSDFLDHCLIIQYFEYDYYLWQEDNYDTLSNMISKLGKQARAKLENRIVSNSSSILGISNLLFELTDPKNSVGKILRSSYDISKPLIDGVASNVINLGYDRIYLTPTQLKKNMNDVTEDEKIVALDDLNRTLTKSQ